jgi:hypothetical protein
MTLHLGLNLCDLIKVLLIAICIIDNNLFKKRIRGKLDRMQHTSNRIQELCNSQEFFMLILFQIGNCSIIQWIIIISS